MKYINNYIYNNDGQAFGISEIEMIKREDIELLPAEAFEKITIKEHDCYFINFADWFGYSVLVYKNNHHIYYANDYELHHKSKGKEELKELYKNSLSHKLYTEDELTQNILSYDEYSTKEHYLRNYWNMQHDYISAFYIGKPGEELEKATEKMFYSNICFCYFKDIEIVKKADELYKGLIEAWNKNKDNIDVFTEMIRYELSNHEAGITCEYTTTLDSLGIKFNNLTDEQKNIVINELNKLINRFM